jgi:hypothetical protein
VIQQFSIRSGLVKRMRSQTATARLTIFLARRIDSGSLGIVNDKGRYHSRKAIDCYGLVQWACRPKKDLSEPFPSGG